MKLMRRSLMAASPYRLYGEANVPRPYGGPAPARGTSAQASGCGKLQIVILSGQKIENSSTHDFALHMSASCKPRKPCLAILIYILEAVNYIKKKAD